MRHHIVLISLDALRPDGLGCYGNPRKPSKNLDITADESLVFTRATTPATWTLPAHMSMLSGLEPPVHGCVSSRHRYPPETLPFPLLFELAEQAGYAPLAVSGGGYMEPQFGFGRGCPDFHIITPIQEALDRVADHILCHPRTFSFFHTYTVHDYPRVATAPKILTLGHDLGLDPEYSGFFPTDQDFHALITALGDSVEELPLGEADLSYLRAIYEASVTITDSTMGAFFYSLVEARAWDQTTVIVTSDHGESLGETRTGVRHFHHGGPPYEHQLRVPLIIRPAEHLRDLLEPDRIEERVSLVDLAPTIMDLMEAPYAREQFDGDSLVDLCMGQVAAFETRRLFFHSCHDMSNRYLDNRLYGSALTWRDNSKMIYDPRSRALREFYWLESDPDELDNRIDDLPQDELRRIDQAITDYDEACEARAHHPKAVQIDDPTVLDRLAELGYIDV